MPQTQPEMTEAYEWRGREVVGPDSEKIGKLSEIYLDQQTGKPEWALVNTGMLGTSSNFVPLAGAKPSGEDVQVQFTKEQVTEAPSVSGGDELSQTEEAQLYSHYGLEYSEGRSDSGLPEGTAGATGSAGAAGDDAMTRSEEELKVGTTREQTGRVRLRKWVETEQVETTVPLRKETARLEREPITDANRDEALSGAEITEAEHEIVLHEEEPVVEKRTVPQERVSLQKDVETEERTVSEEVRKERIEAEGDLDR
ncbi:MAG TPA: PRC and DUF2382 domain-containing protein [Thermoleophilaceae bacterium]|nr:PRC and DUF2382 domain-containing protein [Thermoleophilaceae bacterium]